MTLLERIDASKMSGYQWLIIALCVLLNAMDGFDVLAMAFTAGRVSDEFGLSGGELGLLLSAGLVGMAIGSLTLAPFADVIGRRPMILLSVGLATAGMLLSATANSAFELGAWRVVTGLGIGGILACTNVIASEYSSRRWRGMCISIYTAGYGIGATIGGAVAVTLQQHHGWRSVFIVGGLATGVILILLAVLLPESVAYLVTKRPAGLLERLNRIAKKIGQPATTSLPQPVLRTGTSSNTVSELFSPANRRSTGLIWAAFFAIMFGFYFANSWTPTLLQTAGMTADQSVIGGMALTLGGTFGALLYGALTTKWNSKTVMLIFVVLSAVSMALFIWSVGILALAFILGALVGMLINGCVAGLYTLTPGLYPAQIRSTGSGWAIGVGRVGAILAPMLAGNLLDAGWTAEMLYLGVGAVVLLAAAAVWGLRPQHVSSGAAAPAPIEAEAATVR
ncbi:MFS transporter [Lysinibacter cavernae]|uniref:Benzoate transport n=1 Tax=Lysinibacter cavernae TaxID=1640652 RepID=A0A7X5TS92_9MICO|nr:MFS transporter [Lysinibacter cavernae]NIH53241.1 benzoate transport [Lysinibacter cavernae]